MVEEELNAIHIMNEFIMRFRGLFSVIMQENMGIVCVDVSFFSSSQFIFRLLPRRHLF